MSKVRLGFLAGAVAAPLLVVINIALFAAAGHSATRPGTPRYAPIPSNWKRRGRRLSGMDASRSIRPTRIRRQRCAAVSYGTSGWRRGLMWDYLAQHGLRHGRPAQDRRLAPARRDG